MTLPSSEIRKQFLEYFSRRKHTVVASSSLIPAGDPTLLFTNAGMVQFKDVFLGHEKRGYVRAATAQKCMRVSGKHNDLENVGPSPRHHTFFEMLGNFSFGDYFKKEAIEYAWDLLVNHYELDPDRMWFTVFEGDDEIPADDQAAELWARVGAPSERIRRFGRKENFWMMGETGPCGPNSEIHYYIGPHPKDPKHNRVEYVNGEGDEQVEIWNLVFMQFNRFQSGERYKMEPLPRPSVDTGSGMERLTSVLQNKPSTYETDLFKPMLDQTRKLLGQDKATMGNKLASYRVIADHSRAVAFLIADGVLPGNEGRNYVLRMILRRAARHGLLLGFDGPFLTQVLPTVIEIMGDTYPELVKRQDAILKTTLAEEERFQAALKNGSALLDDLIADLKAKNKSVISGDDAFRLHDTYGFGLEITRDVAREHGLTVDEAGFNKAMEEQRERARAASTIGARNERSEQVYRDAKEKLVASGQLPGSGVEHDPYAGTELDTTVAGILCDGMLTDRANVGDEVQVILPKTCFYVESGGQVSDIGRLVNPSWEIEVTDTLKPLADLVLHVGKVTKGTPRAGDAVKAHVDSTRRWDIMRNHSATHLLHHALRATLGDHVQQHGSLVAPDRFRFDFSHNAMLTREQLDTIERAVNDEILANYPVVAEWMSYKEAIAFGAMALFTEKYGDRVRVVQTGTPGSPFSKELCGGTHVSNTSQIGSFHIVSESSIGAGVRRVEAVTGRGLIQFLNQTLTRLDRAAASLNVSPDQVDLKVQVLVAEHDAQQKEVERLRRELAKRETDRLYELAREVNGVRVLAVQVEAANADTLREMSDRFRDKMGSGIVVLGAAVNGSPSLIAAVTPDLVEKGYDAVKLIRDVARVLGGGGGGRPTLAQAGGRDVGRLKEALDQVPKLVENWK
jgi:alanyl-tRNA synthetase